LAGNGGGTELISILVIGFVFDGVDELVTSEEMSESLGLVALGTNADTLLGAPTLEPTVGLLAQPETLRLLQTTFIGMYRAKTVPEGAGSRRLIPDFSHFPYKIELSFFRSGKSWWEV